MEPTKLIGKIEISYNLQNPLPAVPLRTSENVYNFIRPIFKIVNYRVSIYIIPLFCQKPLGYSKLFQGGLTECPIDVRVIFQLLLNVNADSFIIVRNSTSDNMTASTTDLKCIKNLKECGNIFQIKLIDYLIISETKYYSAIDEGILN